MSAISFDPKEARERPKYIRKRMADYFWIKEKQTPCPKPWPARYVSSGINQPSG
jgi:hypothetical protein